MNNQRATRRRFLQGLVMSLVSLKATAISEPAHFRYGNQDSNLVALLLRAMPLNRSTIAVGRAYAQLDADRGDLKVLCEQLTCRAVSDAGSTPVSLRLDEVREWLRQQIKQDFRDGSVCTLDGWMYSTTELRLMAVHAGTADAVWG